MGKVRTKVSVVKTKVKLSLFNERMLLFMEYIISNKVNGITTAAAYLRSIGYPNDNNVAHIKKGRQSFQTIHLQGVKTTYHADMNFFFEKACTNMFQETKPVSSYVALLEAVHRVGMELAKK